jgi:hypothetical protein
VSAFNVSVMLVSAWVSRREHLKLITKGREKKMHAYKKEHVHRCMGKEG